MIVDSQFAYKDIGRVLIFLFCSFVFSIILSALFIFLFSGITFQSNPWVEMLIQAIPVFLAYLISGLILKVFTRGWNLALYLLVSIICGLVYYLFSFEIVYSEVVDEVYIHIQSIHYIAPVVGVFLGAVILGGLSLSEDS